MYVFTFLVTVTVIKETHLDTNKNKDFYFLKFFILFLIFVCYENTNNINKPLFKI